MRVLGLALVALLAVASGFAVYSRINKRSNPNPKLLERYNRWKLLFGKLYSTPAEQDYRLQIFIQKAEEVDQDNIIYEKWSIENGHGPLDSPAFILQSHADLTKEEFKKKFLGLDVTKMRSFEIEEAPEFPEVPEQANLAQASYIAKIRNQGECGSCWAFSTVATLNKQYFDKYKVQVDLSEQDLVDCSYEDNGCDGGWPANTYYHVADNGIAFDSEYPYRGSVGTCKRTSNLKSGRTTIAGEITSKTLPYTQASAQNFARMGVIAGLAIHAGGKFSSFDFSNDKIYNPAVLGECTKNIDHAVNLGGADGTYTIIHNSWGANWGTKGRGKVQACTGGLLGTPAYITHTYSKLPTA